MSETTIFSLKKIANTFIPFFETMAPMVFHLFEPSRYSFSKFLKQPVSHFDPPNKIWPQKTGWSYQTGCLKILLFGAKFPFADLNAIRIILIT